MLCYCHWHVSFVMITWNTADFLDAAAVVACNRYSKLTLVESPSVFLEFHGNSEVEVAEQASLVGNFSNLSPYSS